MKITAWFGTFEDSGEFVPAGDLAQMVDRLDQAGSAQAGSAGPEAAPPKIQPDFRALALEHGLFEEDLGYNRSLREVAIGLVRRKLRAQADAEADLLQAIEALDDLNEVVNRLDERLYEWSCLHTEGRLRGQKLAEFLEGEEAGSICEVARADLKLRSTRESVQRSLETAVSQMAPNLAEMAGPLLAARLISRAGSLKRLSEMPASAIQVMGAEKALFKHLKGKAPSPKHGMIYRHPAILGTPRRLRGRAARALATKLAIAARIDVYSGEPNPELKAKLDRRIEEIRRAGGKERKERAGRRKRP